MDYIFQVLFQQIQPLFWMILAYNAELSSGLINIFL